MTHRSVVTITAVLLASVAGYASASWELVESTADLVRSDGLKAALNLGPTRCAATGQLDADGVLDLVAGFATEHAGAVVIYRGNEAFRQGVRHDLWRAEKGLPPVPAFLDEALVVDLPFAPDWVAIGDLDADGLADVVCAARGGHSLAILGGDGAGHLGPLTMLTLPGPVSAFAAGEVNRIDSLMDLVVAVDVGGGGAALVFEDPAGVLAAEPEWFPFEAPATGLALGRLDEDPWVDVAVAADDVMVIFGRDRKLAEARSKRDTVAPAHTEAIALEAPSHDLVFGHFVEGSLQQLAVRRADGGIELMNASKGRVEHRLVGRVAQPEASARRLVAAFSSGRSTHDLVIADAENHSLSVVGLSTAKSTAPAIETRGTIDARALEIVAAKLNLDARDDLILLEDAGSLRVAKTATRAVYTVNSTADTDDGHCSATDCTLREAINAANATLLSSSIVMDLGLGATITVTSSLPAVNVASLVIDGTVGSSPLTGPLTLNGSCTAYSCNGINLINGNGVTLTRLSFGGFVGSAGVKRSGIYVETDNNLVTRCLVGVDVWNEATPNDYGILVRDSDNNTIGGSTSSERNVVSANLVDGVYLFGTGEMSGNRVIGNYIGTNSSGNAVLGNGGAGVKIFAVGQNLVGTALTGEGNVIAANAGAGVELSLTTASDFSNTYVLHNLIGVAADGVTAMPNGDGGIRVVNHRNTTIGGSNATSRNVVGGDLDTICIDVQEDSVGTVVRGNYVSLGSDGSTPLRSKRGISVMSSNVTIGGTTRAYGNLVGGNSGFGILAGWDAIPVASIDVMGNVVGTDVSQQAARTNKVGGIRLYYCSSCVVGDPGSSSSGNVVVGTSHYYSDPGIHLWGCDDVQVAGNRVGVTDGGLALANGTGVRVYDSTDCQVGWENIIANNLNDGVYVGGESSAILLLGNSISNNASLGINLNDNIASVTPNDPGDSDSGPNNLQNFPVITGYDPATGLLSATLDSDRPLVTYTIHAYESSVCDPSGYGEGATFLGGTTVVTDASGDASITITATATPGAFVTMLAADPDGNTSEFSLCYAVSDDGDVIFADDFETGNTSGWS